ncbi:selenide, water dikinase [Pseudoflavonifractor capillosus ATCC 29799]|uniref:Selenide, water dikinase n=2 Tax=Pseudoflavonifractor capillosus TaxID=106588 RepID=A6P167_9FIRM|nr:selenide, water dikinase [Pseudoflavonifractor capillosus ATCC 29799]
MVGFDASDDAAVYRINDDTAMIQTADFFPPVVDDPRSFGRIAAANALSDVYAMGGTPRLAINLLCFPTCLNLEIVREILAGGADKVVEAGAVIAGGHSIEDTEPKYGLCVTGFARPEEILTNSGAKPGDLLVLTKPVGTGVLSTAAKAELLTDGQMKEMIGLMSTLNKGAQEVMLPLKPSACTDITGFGLLGHVNELAEGSGVTVRLWADTVPFASGALELAQDGIIPAGAYRNRNYLEGKVKVEEAVALEVSDLLFDPQTAGGLLISIPEERGVELVRRLNDRGIPGAVIGQVQSKGEHTVHVLPHM